METLHIEFDVPYPAALLSDWWTLGPLLTIAWLMIGAVMVRRMKRSYPATYMLPATARRNYGEEHVCSGACLRVATLLIWPLAIGFQVLKHPCLLAYGSACWVMNIKGEQY